MGAASSRHSLRPRVSRGLIDPISPGALRRGISPMRARRLSLRAREAERAGGRPHEPTSDLPSGRLPSARVLAPQPDLIYTGAFTMDHS